MKQLTKEQAIILTGFTGIMCLTDFNEFHKDVERRLGRPFFTHEFATNFEEVKRAYEDDFKKLIGADLKEKKAQ